MIGWYGKLNGVERRTYWACFGGFALDSMDTTIYALVLPVLIAVLGIAKAQAGLLATAALVGAAAGGWIAGILADRFGRVEVLKATILWVALFTGLTALCNDFPQFLVARFLQGLGFGGEAAVGAVLIGEVVRPELRGRVSASVQSGYAVGYAASTALMPIVFSLFPEAVGWRIMFLIGIAPAVLVLFIRRLVPESEIFLEEKRAEQAGARKAAFWEIFQSPHLRSSLPATVMSTGIYGGAYVMITWLPTYLRTALKLPITSTAGYLALNILGSLTGPIVAGLLSDRVGRRPTFMLLLVSQAAMVGVYLFLPLNVPATLALGFIVGALQGGLAAAMLPTFAELFPTEIRASGTGFCLNGGRGFGSVAPAMVGIMAATMPLGRAMGLWALASYALAFIAAIALPERGGADLGADDATTGSAAADEGFSR